MSSIYLVSNYTGRSLATFKRDFAKISDVTPQTWLRKKRLDAAYQLLKSGRANASDVYLRVGFENRTHFISAFKQQYGVTPSAV
jgi:AraC-like DNA-binding protein